MTAKATTRRPGEIAVGDVLYTGGKPARIVRLSQTTALVRLGNLTFELRRKELRRAGITTAKGRAFSTTPGGAT